MDSTTKPYEVVMDDDIKLVAKFIAKSVSSEKRVGVTRGLAALAPIIWGQLNNEDFRALRISPASPMATADAVQIPTTST